MNKRRPPKSIARVTPFYTFGCRAVSISFAVFALFILCLNTLKPQQSSSLRGAAYEVVMPVLTALSAPITMTANFAKNVTGLATLQTENLQLQQENARLSEWYRRATMLETENRYLRDLLKLSPEPNTRYVSARVLSDAGSSFLKTLLVTAGTSENVQKDQSVLSTEGLIGRVVETGKNTSRVLLLTDVNSRVPVLIENTRTHAVLAGQNDRLPSLTYLPPETSPEAGARIITSGYGGVFPFGLPVGRVVFDQDNKPRVMLFVDFSRLTHVRIADTF